MTGGLPVEMQSRFKECLLETFMAFQLFCNTHGIRYYMAYGTAIGVARHNGLIPWDDDIDVLMPREDYQKLLSLQDDINKNYALINYHSKGCAVPYSKFVNMQTTIVEFDYFPVSEGVSIDIFILDRSPLSENEIILAKQKFDAIVKNYQKSVFDLSIRNVIKYAKEFHFGIIYKVLMNNLFYRFIRNRLIKDLEMQEEILASEVSGNFVSYYTYNKIQKEIFPAEWFSSTIEMSFEGIMVPMAVGYDNYLTKVFGDYMTLPPVEKRVSHHSHYYCNLKEHITMEEVYLRLKNGEHYVY